MGFSSARSGFLFNRAERANRGQRVYLLAAKPRGRAVPASLLSRHRVDGFSDRRIRKWLPQSRCDARPGGGSQNGRGGTEENISRFAGASLPQKTVQRT